MKNHSIIQRICLLTSILGLGLPYILADEWLILPAFLVMAGFWMIAKRWSLFWSASILLSVFVFLAAVGMLANLSTLLMLVACTAALAWWDLATFGDSIVPGQSMETSAPLEKHHLQSLALAVSGGLIMAIVSSYINLHIPFIGIVFLVLLTIGCLIYAMQSLVKKDV